MLYVKENYAIRRNRNWFIIVLLLKIKINVSYLNTELELVMMYIVPLQFIKVTNA